MAEDDIVERFNWLYATADRIRQEAGHDAARFEALLDSPVLAEEALAKFPGDPLLHEKLKSILYADRIFARRGLFAIDGPPTEEQLRAANKKGHEILAEWKRTQRELDDET